MGNTAAQLRRKSGVAPSLLCAAASSARWASPIRSDCSDDDEVKPNCSACTAAAARIFCGGEHTLLRDPETLEVYQLGACGLGFDHEDSQVAADAGNYTRRVPLSGPALSVFPGRYHNFLRLPGGRCYAYGCGRQSPNDGQLMNGSVEEATAPVSTTARFTNAALGGHHSLVRNRAGEVWACGAGWQGQMGDGQLRYTNEKPVQIPGLPRIARVATGYYHAAAFAEDGRCFVWGCNEQGQLGQSDAQIRSPQLFSDVVPELQGLRIADFGAGYGHTVLRLEDGRVLTLGNHVEGQRAVCPDDDEVPIITEVVGLPGPAQAIAAGNHHTLVLVKGSVWAFGSDEFGQVTGRCDVWARDVAHQVWTPKIVEGFPQCDPIIRIDAGMYHSAAQTSSGRIFVWGCGSNGQTGDGSLPETTPLSEIVLAEVSQRCQSASVE